MLGGPGSGKSTLAWYVAAKLKMAQVEVELVREHVKQQAYEGRHPESFDQVHLFALQMKDEDLALRNGVDVIVTESPVLMSACYGYKLKAPGHGPLLNLAREFEQAYPSLNIFLIRPAKYNKKGRFQDLEAAKELDSFIRDMHLGEGLELFDFDCMDSDAIAEFVVDQVEVSLRLAKTRGKTPKKTVRSRKVKKVS